MTTYYPIHPQPFSNESFSSWLIRLIRGNIGDQPLHRFIRLEFGKGASIWNRDTDRSVAPQILSRLSERTGRSVAGIKSLLISDYQGVVFEKHNPNGGNRWVLPIGVYHRTRRLFGQQWCPMCLSTDPKPYYRKSWRMAFSSSCSIHGRLLADRCKHCQKPCIPHRGSFLKCHECNADLTKQKTILADSIALQAEYKLNMRSIDGQTALYSESGLHPILYFDIWYQILGLLTFSKRSQLLRRNICRHYGGKDFLRELTPVCRSFEYLDVEQRHCIMALAGRLMEGWPFRFVGLCAESEVWSSCVLKDMKPIRFELYNIAKTYLVGPLVRSNPTLKPQQLL